MLLEEAFEAHLANDPKVLELVDNAPLGKPGVRIFPVWMQEPVFPAIIYYRDSSPGDYTHNGPSGSVTTTIHVLCSAKIYREVKELAKWVRKACNGFGQSAGRPARLGGADGVDIGGIFIEDDKDLPYAFDEEETWSCYFVLLVMKILHSED